MSMREVLLWTKVQNKSWVRELAGEVRIWHKKDKKEKS